jgi:L-fucose mutarotase
MLKNIPKILSPDLLKILDEMGHGDEIVIADANFPAASIAAANAGRLVLARGHGGVEIARAIISLIPLDSYADPNAMLMEASKGDTAPTSAIWGQYQAVLEEAEGAAKVKTGHLERFAFYERAKTAYAIIATGETALYANLILKKGVL